MAEAAGTALLVGIGTGSIVWGARAGGLPQWELAAAWFLAVLLPILLFIHVSGAHLNPAVTLALAASGRVAWREAPAYLAGQLSGAFLGSATVLGLLGRTDRLGATVPSDGGVALAFGLELGFTAALVGSVFILSDEGEGRHRWRVSLPPLVVGVSTFLIGPLTGSSLNPVRTLAPAVLSGTYTGLWVYLLAVPLGALVVARAWRPTAVDRLDRGPGRVEVTT
ncbi:MAG: aquaporin [Thermoplasmata archaeon]|nr:aquaporin [Thermoplasmata archaeon]